MCRCCSSYPHSLLFPIFLPSTAGLDAESVELICSSLGLEAIAGLCDVLADSAASAADKAAAVAQQLGAVKVRRPPLSQGLGGHMSGPGRVGGLDPCVCG